MPIVATFLHFFLHCNELFRVGHCVMAPPLETPCSIQRQIQRKILFCLEITMVLGQKNCQNRDIFTVVNFFYYLIKCRFNQLSFRSSVVSLKCRFDQVSFRSNVASINFCFDQISFDQLSFDKVSFDQLLGHAKAQSVCE